MNSLKRFSPSARTVEILLGLLATTMLAAGLLLYALGEPERIALARQAQVDSSLDEAMTLYAENCAVCHGLAGEGIGAIPALNRTDLQTSDFTAIQKIISRGLFNTAMPAWALEDGGSLSDYQIDELVTLIQYGDWAQVQDRVVNLGLAPLVPFSAQPDPDLLDSLAALPNGSVLSTGVTLYAEYCVACHGADGLGTTLAPALNDPSVREQDPASLERTLLNGVSGTLMAGWRGSLTDEETTALITLLTSWVEVPVGTIPAPDQPVPVTAESLALGSDLYSSTCSHCHGPEGQGTQRAPSLNVKGFLEDTSDSAMQQIITQGVPGTAMPAWGDRITEAEIQAIVVFIRAWEPDAPQVAEPARTGGGPWWATNGGAAPSGQQGGGQGGPPWLRQNNTAPSSQLPSGGQSAAPAASQTITHTSTMTSTVHTPAGGGGYAASQGGQASGTGNTSGQAGPPWAQSQPAAELPWWQSLWQEADPRALSLLGGGGMLTLLVALWATWRLLRLT